MSRELWSTSRVPTAYSADRSSEPRALQNSFPRSATGGLLELRRLCRTLPDHHLRARASTKHDRLSSRCKNVISEARLSPNIVSPRQNSRVSTSSASPSAPCLWHVAKLRSRYFRTIPTSDCGFPTTAEQIPLRCSDNFDLLWYYCRNGCPYGDSGRNGQVRWAQ